MGFVSTQLSSLTTWNTLLRKILKGSEGLAGKNLMIQWIERDYYASYSKSVCPR